MQEPVSYELLTNEVNRIFGAFDQEFKRFERFAIDRFYAESLPNLIQQLQVEGYSLAEAKNQLNDLAALKTRFTGKKREWAAAKKRIGRITDALDRASAGQNILHREVSMLDRLENARLSLELLIGFLTT